MLLPSLLLLAAAAPQEPSFARYRIDPAGEIIDTLVTDADGDGLSEIWLATLEDGVRRISVSKQLGSQGFAAEPAHTQPISKAVVAWSAGNFLPDEGAELLLTTREAVYLQSLGGRPRKILDSPMLLDLPSETELPVLREVADLNADGLDEIVIPTREGYTLLAGDGTVLAEIPWAPREGRSPVAQQELFGGAATATLSSRALSDLFVPEESPGVVSRPPLMFTSSVLPRPTLEDLNGDGRIDFSFHHRNQIRVHLQDEDGGFPRGISMRLDLPELKSQDNEVLRWGQFGGGPGADLLLVRSGGGLGVSYEWQIRVWFDPVSRGELGEVGHFRKVEGSWVRPTITDLDGDGLPELGVSIWELELGLTLRDPRVTHGVYVFRAQADGTGWETRAALASERSYGVDDLESFAVVPSFPGDLNGDGQGDTLQSSGDGELEFRALEWAGAPRVGDPFLRVPVDALAAVVRVRDLNSDGVGDLLVAHLGHWEIYLSRR